MNHSKTSALKHLCAAFLCAAALLCFCCLQALAEPSDVSAVSHVGESQVISGTVSEETSNNTSEVSEISHEESAPESETQPSEVSEEPSENEISEEEYVYEREHSEDDTPSKIKVKKSTSDTEEEEDDTPRTKNQTAWTFIKNKLIYFVPLIVAGLCIYFLIRYNKNMNAKNEEPEPVEDPENPSLSSFSTKGKNHRTEDETEKNRDDGQNND